MRYMVCQLKTERFVEDQGRWQNSFQPGNILDEMIEGAPAVRNQNNVMNCYIRIDLSLTFGNKTAGTNRRADSGNLL